MFMPMPQAQPKPSVPIKKKPKTKEEIIKELNELLEDYIGLEKDDHIKEKVKQMETEFSVSQGGLVFDIDEDYVALNVGGKIFTTTKSTLRAVPDSKLDKMITGRFPLLKDENGNIFLDRNPDYFPYILEFLRDGSIIYPSDSFKKQRITRELKFFECISTIKNTFVLDKTKKANDLTVSDDELTAWKSGFEKNSAILGDKFLDTGVYQWQVEILQKNVYYYQAFGVCSSTHAHANVEGFYYNSFPCVTTQSYACMMMNNTIPALQQGDIIEFTYDADTRQLEVSCPARNLNTKANVMGDNIKPFFLVYGNGDKFSLSFK